MTTDSDRIDSQAAPEPVGAYPHARRAGNLLFLSGVGPRKRASKDIPGVTLGANGEVVAKDIDAQCRSCFEQCQGDRRGRRCSMDERGRRPGVSHRHEERLQGLQRGLRRVLRGRGKSQPDSDHHRDQRPADPDRGRGEGRRHHRLMNQCDQPALSSPRLGCALSESFSCGFSKRNTWSGTAVRIRPSDVKA